MLHSPPQTDLTSSSLHVPASSERSPSPARSSGSQTSLVRPPKSSRRPKGSPLLSPASTPSTPPLAVTSTAAPARSIEPERTLSSTSNASRHSSGPSSPRQQIAAYMLPSHPAALPHMYDSTASTTDDADGEHESAFGDDASAGAALLAERRREDARAARRRAKQDVAGGRSRVGRGGAVQEVSRAELDTARAVSNALQLSRQMPFADGRNGLGFAFAEEGGYYDQHTSQPRRSSRSAPASPHAPSFTPRASSRLHTTQDAGVAIETDSATSTSRRVRFEQPYRPPGRERLSSGSRITLQPEHIVFPDALPSPPEPHHSVTSPRSLASRRSSAASSSMFSPKSVAISSPATSLASSSPVHPPSASPRPRNPRRASGPSMLVPNDVAPRPGSKFYFPSAPAKPAFVRSHEIASPTPSEASTLPVVFPSRTREKRPQVAASAIPHSSGHYNPPPVVPSPIIPATADPAFPSRQRTAFETAAPFPVRQPKRSSPSPASPFLTQPFPAKPSPRVHGSPFPLPPSDSPHARFLAQTGGPRSKAAFSPSSASDLWTVTVDEPIVPSAAARNAGEEGARVAPSRTRRAQSAPWVAPPALAHGLDGDNTGDELDRMMRAQRRDDLGEDSVTRDREERRRNIYAELLKATGVPPVPRLPSIPPLPLDLAFDRAVLNSETKRRSLSASLLSEEVATRRSSTTPTITFETAHLTVGDLRRTPSEGSDLGSLAAYVSLDHGLNASVSSTGSDISSLPSFPDVPSHLAPPVPLLPAQYQGAGAPPIVVSGLTRPFDEREVPPADRAGPPSTSAGLKRLSMVSLYEDALSSPAAAAEVSPQEVSAAPVDTVHLNGDPQQHAREWVETLAGGPGRSLGDIGEEPEGEDESRLRARQAVLVTPPTAHRSTFTSPVRAARSRELSAESSVAVPSSPRLALHRTHSPAPSARSVGSSALSYVHTSPKSPLAAGHFKQKLALGKKLGALFGSGAGAGAGGAGVGLGSGVASSRAAVSSRDVRPLALGSTDSLGSGWEPRTRESSHASSGVEGGEGGSVTPSPSRSAFPAAHPDADADAEGGKENAAPPQPRRGDADGLSALLARFELEERERFREIAAARALGALRGRGGGEQAIAA